MRFLRRFLKGLLKSTSDISLPEKVYGEEDLSRYLLSSSYFARTKGQVKYSAFMPNSQGKTSIYRVSGLEDETIWEIGENFVRKPIIKKQPSCKLHGRADFKGNAVFECALEVVADTSPHPRHADLVGWADNKPSRQMAATQLANSARLRLLALD